MADEEFTTVPLARVHWSIRYTLERMNETGKKHMVGQVGEFSIHIVLIPVSHTGEFTGLVNRYIEAIRESY